MERLKNGKIEKRLKNGKIEKNVGKLNGNFWNDNILKR